MAARKVRASTARPGAKAAVRVVAAWTTAEAVSPAEGSGRAPASSRAAWGTMFMGEDLWGCGLAATGLSLRLPGLALFPTSSPSRHGPLSAWAPGGRHSAQERAARARRGMPAPRQQKGPPRRAGPLVGGMEPDRFDGLRPGTTR